MTNIKPIGCPTIRMRTINIAMSDIIGKAEYSINFEISLSIKAIGISGTEDKRRIFMDISLRVNSLENENPQLKGEFYFRCLFKLAELPTTEELANKEESLKIMKQLTRLSIDQISFSISAILIQCGFGPLILSKTINIDDLKIHEA